MDIKDTSNLIKFLFKEMVPKIVSYLLKSEESTGEQLLD